MKDNSNLIDSAIKKECRKCEVKQCRKVQIEREYRSADEMQRMSWKKEK